MTIRAVLFDAYGTLFDVHSVALRAEQMYPGAGEKLSLLWRERQIEYTRLVSMGGRAAGERYRPFWDLTRAALRNAAARLQLELAPAAEDALMNEYRHLSAFPENREVLAELKRRGVPAGVLSNGDPEMLEVAVKSAGFAELLHPVLSVHATRRYKPDPAVYALGCAAFGLPAKDILFVSSNGWDAIGATWYGYTTLWVNRAGAPLDPLDTEPSHRARSLREVLDLIPSP
ncbi:MAG: haloacid dehalogenase type II [Burkholderiales bacterium]|nr:haloacid dehalogenase type II [Burkholderiales bacterium]MDE1927640.1 haloacid dehalogenase type II [Burkholderiales bacterium]MDE2158889.1 haloacid dehalogenase type II [Burkholderiales bacterium]MDE2504954.1 haloacid dehalogenase type II [Burkholderiales bacterium]